MQNTIKEKLKEAMMAKNEVVVLTLRNIISSFTNELVSKGKKPTDVLTDEECLAIIARLAKQRRDSIEQFTNGDRADLAENEMAELAVINEFLPTQMTEAEITEFLKNYIANNTIDAEIQQGKKGQALGSIMKELKGKADGSLVKQIFDSLI